MRALPILFLLGFTAAAAAGDFQPTFQATRDSIAQDSDCTQVDYPDLVIFTCETDKALWYFTKPGNPAHPGVVKRAIVQNADGSISVHESARSFGSDDAQPAFKAWLDSIVALDRKVKDELAREHSQH